MMTDSSSGDSDSAPLKAPGSRPRAYVYIDGFNLYYGALREHPERKWLNMELLAQRLLPTADVRHIVYCIARVQSMHYDVDVNVRQDLFFQALKAECPNLEIVEGTFKTRTLAGERIPERGCSCCDTTNPTVTCNCCSHVTSRIRKPEEKGSDVNLAARLISDGYKDLYDVALVVSGDSDLQLAVDIVRNDVGKRVIVCDPRGKARYLVGDEMRVIRKTAYAKCQMPRPVIDAQGKELHPPKTWE